MSTNFETVDIPNGRDAGINDELVSALLDAEKENKAIVVELETGTNFINWQSNLRNKLRRLNPPKRLRTKHDKTNRKVTAWVEDVPDA